MGKRLPVVFSRGTELNYHFVFQTPEYLLNETEHMNEYMFQICI